METKNKKMLFAKHLANFSDDVGIFQHSKYGVADLSHGYTTDDNCRALILAVELYERFKKDKYLKLIYRYIAFMVYAQNDDGMFKNFMGYNREFLEAVGSQDCFGRCMWALGRTLSSNAIPENIKRSCWHMVDQTRDQWLKLESPRAKAYTIVGLSYLEGRNDARHAIEVLSEALTDQYRVYKEGDWHWFENSMTYGNAFFPWALLRAYHVLGKEVLLHTAKESMKFLEKMTMTADYFKPIGCNGWLNKGESAAAYDEQPLEACETLLLFLEYYKLTKDKDYLKKAEKCYYWYKGLNSKGLSLIDPSTGACYDGINERGLNLNQGSESIVSYGIAFMEITGHTKIQKNL